MSRTPAKTAPSVPAPADRDAAMRVIEALLFVADEPVTVAQIRQVLDDTDPDAIRELLDQLEEDLRTRGSALRIEAVAGGSRMTTRPEIAPWIRAFVRARNRTRLSAAAIETLAVIAYKQPVTAPEIQEIRGVDPQGSLKSLLEKRLVRVCGKRKVVGRPFLYGTTRDFLMHFGLAVLEDLPPIEDFERLAGALAEVEGAGGEGGGEGEGAEPSDPSPGFARAQGEEAGPNDPATGLVPTQGGSAEGGFDGPGEAAWDEEEIDRSTQGITWRRGSARGGASPNIAPEGAARDDADQDE